MSDSNFINREKRFEVNELIGFDAVVTRDDTDESVFYANLIDFSRRGGKFELPFCARFDEILTIKFEFKDSDLFYQGEGRVRHMRNVGENRWQVGCSLDPPLPDDVVAYLAKQTNQERRRHQRFDIFGVGKLRRQGTPDGCEAVIRNISRGGFCLIVANEHEIGEKVDFIIDETSEHEDPQQPKDDEKLNVGARIRWQSHTDEGYLIGCSFSDAKSYNKLVDYLVGDHQEKTDKTSWLVLAAAILAMAFPVGGSIFYSAKNVQVGTPAVARSQPNVSVKSPVSTVPPDVNEPTVEEDENSNQLLAAQPNSNAPQPPATNDTKEDPKVIAQPQESPVPETEILPGTDPQPQIAKKKPKVTSTKIDLASNRKRNSSRRPQQEKSASDSPSMDSTNKPEFTVVNKDGVPLVLAESASKTNTKTVNDRGSSRRVKSSRPIIVESEKIFPDR